MPDYARNPTVSIPVDVPLYDGYTPLSGQAASLSLQVLCLDNGWVLDSDNAFKIAPAAPLRTLQAYSNFANIYYHLLQPATWGRGHYRALVQRTNGQAWAFDFSLGIRCDRRLNYSAIYTGTHLKLTLWVEEEGQPQSDYLALRNLRVRDYAGGLVDSWPDHTIPNNGLFAFDREITLASNTNYLLECTAQVAGVPDAGGTPHLHEFFLRLGLARP